MLTFDGFSKIDFQNIHVDNFNAGGTAGGGAVEQVEFLVENDPNGHWIGSVSADIEMRYDDKDEYPWSENGTGFVPGMADGPRHTQTRLCVKADPAKWAWTGPLGNSRPPMSNEYGKNAAFEV